MSEEMRRAFFEMVARFEQDDPEAAIATSIACLAVLLARLHGQRKPVVGDMPIGNKDALQELIDQAWPTYATLPPDELQEAADYCAEHLRSRGVVLDLGIYGPAAKV
jgi:hypothetical protein